MKIAFVGAECTGKSTMSKLLAEKLGLPHIPDPYERAIQWCKDRGLTASWNLQNDEFNFNFEKGMHHAQLEMEKEHESFVVDSSSLVRAACGFVMCSTTAPQKELEELVAASVANAESYDLHIYCPATMFTYVDNGHRLMNGNIRHAVDLILQSLVDASYSTSINTRGKSVEDDIRYLCTYLNRCN